MDVLRSQFGTSGNTFEIASLGLVHPSFSVLCQAVEEGETHSFSRSRPL